MHFLHWRYNSISPAHWINETVDKRRTQTLKKDALSSAAVVGLGWTSISRLDISIQMFYRISVRTKSRPWLKNVSCSSCGMSTGVVMLESVLQITCKKIAPYTCTTKKITNFYLELFFANDVSFEVRSLMSRTVKHS